MGLRVPETLVLVGARSGDLPDDFDERIAKLGPGPLAIRSSAIGEDGAEASFAGQYETVLGVRGEPALREAIAQCLDSASSARANAYREAQGEAGERAGTGGIEARGLPGRPADPVEMSIIIQPMVEARVSGVCFTADPVTSRRNRLVLDAVVGLGDALVSGHASADHEELQRSQRRWEPTQLAGEAPVLSFEERQEIAREALLAESRAGEPLDLEWAIDASGTLFWLQARPITTLGLDPQTLDTRNVDERDVFTRCNVGEMMPGAVSPLTFSTCARGIDVGWQRILDSVGLLPTASSRAAYIGMSHGHLFINLSEGARFSSEVTGASPDQQSLAICGRVVPEVQALLAPPLLVRIPRITRQIFSILTPRSKLRRMEELVAGGAIEIGQNGYETWQGIDRQREALFEAYRLHLVVSSGAGALAAILLGRLAGQGEPSGEHHAIVAHLLAGAEGVESAEIAEGAARILEALEAGPDRSKDFVKLGAAAAVDWLATDASGEAGRKWRSYLERHGHRSLRELDIRQSEWAHDPTPLVRSLQVQLRGRIAEGRLAEPASRRAAVSDPPPGVERFARIRGLAHGAVRNRERAKSLLVASTVHHKRGYRALAKQLVEEGRLLDADAVYFLTHEELGRLAIEDAGSPLASEALRRRDVLAYQETLSFPEVAVGLPQPEPPRVSRDGGQTIVGKPVSRGRVEGRVRVVHTLEEAEALEPGEILVAPITDVGWTPYFAIIAGLVTDVGSAVSHGAVVAREYGLPAVLNTREGTRMLRTGERVVLDGDRGIVERLED
ncbi:MAG: pyruvate, water dikinase [Deltaproteobacteria bacterium]|nr:pyruvate, water dikinase [Deltaproteobacteria bacterium]